MVGTVFRQYMIALLYSSYSAVNPGCFQRKNVWLVNHSGLVIATYNIIVAAMLNRAKISKFDEIRITNILTTHCE